jgi:hypothetical protein
MYAGCIARLLDPGGAFFGDRIIAQGADRAEEMVPDQAKSLMQVGASARATRVARQAGEGQGRAARRPRGL